MKKHSVTIPACVIFASALMMVACKRPPEPETGNKPASTAPTAKVAMNPSQSEAGKKPATPSIAQKVKTDPLVPYSGESLKGVDTTSLNGKIMAGYQGWFNAQGDGANLGWTHWARQGPFAPGNVTVDLWPDMSEATASERFATGFKHANGETAYVFSSYNRDTVLRHFKWMRDYGIDGVFVQRFANGVKNPSTRHHKDTVLSSCREGANRNGRSYAVMYDLSGLGAGATAQLEQPAAEFVLGLRVARIGGHLGAGVVNAVPPLGAESQVGG